MKKRTIIAALLLVVAGLQGAWAQSMRVNLSGNKYVFYNLSDVKSVSFFENDMDGIYEYVDLGLPSGTLWATCNIGADTPEEEGNKYAWGETYTKESYLSSNYRYGTSNPKYTGASGDYLITLLPEDDAATVNWGENWQTPSMAQLTELIDESNTTIEKTTTGTLITSNSNGKSIFLPNGRYWTRTLDESNSSSQSYIMISNASASRIMRSPRYSGHYVRPVRAKEKNKVCEYVDLGLPSGTKWATCNVGAGSPDERGDHFAWGETQTKPLYNWGSYSLGSGSETTIKKYTSYDGLTELEATDDVATVLWGEDWQMPSQEQVWELRNSSDITWTWEKMDEAYGYLVTSNINGNSIFLPTTGFRENDVFGMPARGYYWSRTLSPDDQTLSYGLIPSPSFITADFVPRYYGHCVRPVLVKNAHECVDLGLPSGTLWATCNIGAENPEDYGLYFAWGETETKETYSWGNYLLGEGSSGVAGSMTKYNATDGMTELLPEDDAATVIWGSNWQMPSKEQFDELIDENNTTTEMTTNGLIITSKFNNNSILFPNAGQYGLRGWNNVGKSGYYWSRTRHASYAQDAHLLLSQSSNNLSTYGDRFAGKTIRPVKKQ